MAAKQPPAPGLALSVCGETVDFNMVYNAPLDLAGRRVALGPYLTFLAKGSDLGGFRTKAYRYVRTTVENIVNDTLLYQQAKREGGDKLDEGVQKAAQNVWREFVLQHGGNDAAAEEALKAQGLDRKEFLKQQKRQILTHYLVSLRLRSDQPISHKELVEAYERMKDQLFVIKPRVTFRSIDIQPSRLQLTDLGADRSEQARQLANRLLAYIHAGQDIAALASQYSHGPMANNGGLWDAVDPCSLAEPYDRLAKMAMDMEVGQVRGPIELGGQVFILALVDKQRPGYLLLDQVQEQVQQQILRERRRRAQEQLQNELAERAKVGQIEGFVEAFIQELYRRSEADHAGA
ncbi:MAG: peptidylprolyl isomerase [Sedimentisphaerales bacterium]|nr:peptidylprolyl isomerase [Sedimentisphaerales bacterium]